MRERVIGFVGLGRMGAPMARRLNDSGWNLVVYDHAGSEGRTPHGARAMNSVAQISQGSDVVFLSLPDGKASLAVCAELAHATDRRVRIVVELSTVGTEEAETVASILTRSGITYVDAPVGGGTSGAVNGTLTMMIAGPDQDLTEIQMLLDVLARAVFRVGERPGQGQAMKLANNFLNATALAATSEAVLFGTRFGLKTDQMIEVFNASTGRNSATQEKFPRSVLPGTCDFGFAGALMAKDMDLYARDAEHMDAPRLIGEAVAHLWTAFNQAHPGADFTYIHRFLAEKPVS